MGDLQLILSCSADFWALLCFGVESGNAAQKRRDADKRRL